ncbi:MAG: hypothetical protein ACOC1F_03080 [Myxococcota bacterium]
MPLSVEQREHVLQTTVEILRHPRRDKLLRIVQDRIENDDYPDEGERELDRVIFALARALDEDLGG